MSQLASDTAQREIEETVYRDHLRGQEQLAGWLVSPVWVHKWLLEFSRNTSVPEASQRLEDYLHLLNNGNLGNDPGSVSWLFAVGRRQRDDGLSAHIYARGLTAGTDQVTINRMRDRWKHGKSEAGEIHSPHTAADHVAEALTSRRAMIVKNLPDHF